MAKREEAVRRAASNLRVQEFRRRHRPTRARTAARLAAAPRPAGGGSEGRLPCAGRDCGEEWIIVIDDVGRVQDDAPLGVGRCASQRSLQRASRAWESAGAIHGERCKDAVCVEAADDGLTLARVAAARE
eukprot:scaffold16041_cov90-Isochrysis_galbana.AAC.2